VPLHPARMGWSSTRLCRPPAARSPLPSRLHCWATRQCHFGMDKGGRRVGMTMTSPSTRWRRLENTIMVILLTGSTMLYL
jgi:hypothetical protein